jgi:hypothetical protein
VLRILYGKMDPARRIDEIWSAFRRRGKFVPKARGQEERA